MKATDWHAYLEEQRRRHHKLLFSVTELANVAGTTRHNVNVELGRLRAQGVIERYARGAYGIPDAVNAEDLLRVLDRKAYLTGLTVLHRSGLATQAPTRSTCFTSRRHSSRERRTAAGRFLFVCVRPPVYAPPDAGIATPAEQALLDFVYLCRRKGVDARSVVTFRHLESLDYQTLSRLKERYPKTVQEEVVALMERKT
jgi:hypothetical protein